MIELGKVQKLKIIRDTSIGVYLNCIEDEGEEDILLPRKQVPEDFNVEDEIEVFVYRDSEDRMIATTRSPKIKIGEFKFLKAVDKTKIGAFLDWGLEKDLLLPFNEQTNEIEIGKEYIVALYVDKSDRLCATMKINKMLREYSTYEKDDEVTGIIYNVNPEMGAFVIIDGKYDGLIPKNEMYNECTYGKTVEGRVTKVREDGKVYLSIRKKAYLQMDEDSTIILEKIQSQGGVLYLNDKSDPDKIKSELNMSKRAFKRGVGRLLKERKIKFIENGIKTI